MEYTNEWRFSIYEIARFNILFAHNKEYKDKIHDFNEEQQNVALPVHVAEMIGLCIRALAEENSKNRSPKFTIELMNTPIFINEMVRYIIGFDNIPSNDILIQGINRGLLLTFYLEKDYYG